MVGFTLQYEMSFTNILNMLDLAGIPLFAKDRGDDMPLVAAGGPCAYNAEPLADYIDVFFLGESEESTQVLADTIIAWKEQGKPGGKKGLLKQLSQQPGNYVPSFYEAHYDDNGDFQGLTVTEPGAPAEIEKCVVSDVEHVFSRPSLSSLTSTSSTTGPSWNSSAAAAGAAVSVRPACFTGRSGKIAGTPGGSGQTDYRQFRLQ